MKKSYETPIAEKIEFCYQDQIVASGNQGCISIWVFRGDYSCEDDNKFLEHTN